MDQVGTLSYIFKNPALLKEALTHPSVVKPGMRSSYERLEFIGDRVLGLCVAELLFVKQPDADEGDLSRVHANLVGTGCLATVAKALDLGAHIFMGRGEDIIGGRNNPRNLENTLEAVLGAIFLDSDYETVRNVIWDIWEPLLWDEEIAYKRDYKSELQELSQKQYKVLPRYVTISVEGEAHQPVFTVEVNLGEFDGMTATGRTRKEAEMMAAKTLIERLDSCAI